MKASSRQKPRSKTAKKNPKNESCDAPGHCPPYSSAKMTTVMPPRLKRTVPPEAERRAFEDAVNGWWWL